MAAIRISLHKTAWAKLLYSEYGIHREEWQAGIHDSGADVSYTIANDSTL